MAKAKFKERTYTPDVDATPERLRHADREAQSWGGTSGSYLESTTEKGQAQGKQRNIRTTRVDHLYNLGALSWGQWYAANWYRTRIEIGMGGSRLVADYGRGNGGGGGFHSALPLSAQAESARADLNQAKKVLTLAQRQWVEDAIDDPHPPMYGRAATERCNGWRAGLQALAVYLRVAG